MGNKEESQSESSCSNDSLNLISNRVWAKLIFAVGSKTWYPMIGTLWHVPITMATRDWRQNCVVRAVDLNDGEDTDWFGSVWNRSYRCDDDFNGRNQLGLFIQGRSVSKMFDEQMKTERTNWTTSLLLFTYKL